MMPDSLAQVPPRATTCKNECCRYTNGGAFIVCPICKTWQHSLPSGNGPLPSWREYMCYDDAELLRDDNNQRVKDWQR